MGYNPVVSFLTPSPREISQRLLVCLRFAGLIETDTEAVLGKYEQKEEETRGRSTLRGWETQEGRYEAAQGRGVRWAAPRSGGLKSLWRSDEGRHIQKRG